MRDSSKARGSRGMPARPRSPSPTAVAREPGALETSRAVTGVARRAALLLLSPLTLAALAGCSEPELPTGPAPERPLFNLEPGQCEVTSPADDGAGTLRALIADEACTTITFGITGKITLTSGQLAIRRDLHISGPGADRLTVERDSSADPFRIFRIFSRATASISGLTVANGWASGSGGNDGGGIRNDGTLTLSESTISGNTASLYGGGIENGGILTLIRSTVSGNSARLGGGIAVRENASTVTTILSSTISGNEARRRGGGVYIFFTQGGPTRIVFSTITRNHGADGGGGVMALDRTDVKGSLIWGNTIGPDEPLANVVGGSDAFNSLGHNLIGDLSGFAAQNFAADGDQTATDVGSAGLDEELKDNGGPTSTHALLTDSPAIDAGTCEDHDGDTVTTDQRGFDRPAGSGCDIGAFEFEGSPSDDTPPVLTANVDGTLGNNGWYTSDVTVSWSVVDDESEVTTQTGCGPTTIDSDGDGVTLTCEATSAGGTASASVTIQRDATPPTLSPTVSPDPVLLGGSVTTSPNAEDGVSGVASESCEDAETDSTGEHMVTCTATDQAGNQAEAQVSYGVHYAFEGFFPPVKNDGAFNKARAGRTIPLKWRLLDAHGEPVTDLTGVELTVEHVACSRGHSRGWNKAGAAGWMRWIRWWHRRWRGGHAGWHGNRKELKHLGNGYYRFNWKTERSYAHSCKALHLDLGEGRTPHGAVRLHPIDARDRLARGRREPTRQARRRRRAVVDKPAAAGLGCVAAKRFLHTGRVDRPMGILGPGLLRQATRACAILTRKLRWVAPVVLVHAPAGAQTAASPDRAGHFAGPFVHESWTVQQGLPVNSINALLQSRDGYLWIATFDGLARFDGVRFTVFNTGNSPGLPSNRILGLLEARDGSLWLRTGQRQLVHFREGRFTHVDSRRGLSHRVRAMSEDADGTLWVATQDGIGRVRDDTFSRVAPETIGGVIRSILVAEETVWAGSSAGALYRIENDHATAVAADDDLGRRPVSRLFVEPDGTLWIGTGNGVWRYRGSLDRITGAGQVLAIRRAPATGDIWILTQSETLRHDGSRVEHVLDRDFDHLLAERMIPDRAGHMMYPSGRRLYRAGELVYELPAPRDGGDEPYDLATITSVVLDHEGSLWLGTNGSGLHRLKPALFTVYGSAEGLSGRNVYSVYEDRSGAMWFGTLAAGVNRLAAGRVTQPAPDAFFPVYARSFLQDRTGRLWVGADTRGLRVCSTTAFRCSPAGPEPLRTVGVRALHEDAAGALWIGTDHGVYRAAGGDWTRFTEADGAPTSAVRVFRQTRDRALWMGTNGGGLFRYQDARFRQINMRDGLPLNLVRSLHLDEDGWLWVGTEGRGLARLDPREWTDDSRAGRIVAYGTADGLFDDVIHQILEDDDGRLWMSSNRGIFRVDRRELLDFADGRSTRITSTGYTEADGLRNREANGGSQPAGVRASDGRLWFPTQDGVAVVDPARVGRNDVPPNVVIEQVTAGGSTMRADDSVLELGVHQRDLEIEYTALSFLAPSNMRFRTRLEPYDTGWVDAGTRRTAYYTRVPPGRYTFHVAASNNDGVWNEAGASIDLRLAPRFYETNAFRLAGLATLAVFLVLLYHWRVHALRARALELRGLVDERTRELREHQQQLAVQNAKLALQTEQLQEMDQAKSRFFANVSHEFRTPLTLILGPLRDLTDGRRDDLPHPLKRQLEMMLRNAQRLLRLVNQVLDLARLESGSLALKTEPHDLVHLARCVARSFTPLAERRDVELRFEPEAEHLPVLLDADQMEKVLLNLLSNAFKFTDAGGRVAVTVREEDGTAVVQVRDSGIGIAPEQLPRVFERFYQADSSATRRHEGTGIGLSLARELVELHGGGITAASEPGKGSVFELRLPCADVEPVRLPPARDLGAPGHPERAEHSELAPRHGATVESGPGDPHAGSPADHALESAGGGPTADRTTVLVIDDHADIRAYVRTVLEPAFRVIEAADGREGLDLAREVLPDLIVADVMMPQMDGVALTRALREDDVTDCIPVILLTARASEDDEVEGLGTGADDYITKPFHAGVLEARVSALIASRHRLRERFREDGPPPPAPAPPRSDLEQRLRSLIELNLAEPDFNPEALAAAAGLSYKQLYRRLAAELDTTPSGFIRTVRVERAADMLRDGAGSITEIAYSVGFNSLSYFHRCFKQRFGVAPSATQVSA